MPSTKTMQAFNVKTQAVEDFTVVIDQNSDYVFTAADGGQFKLAGSLGAAGVAEALAAYEAANKGQIPHDTTIAAAEDEAKLNDLDTIGATDTQAIGGVEALIPNEVSTASDTTTAPTDAVPTDTAIVPVDPSTGLVAA